MTSSSLLRASIFVITGLLLLVPLPHSGLAQDISDDMKSVVVFDLRLDDLRKTATIKKMFDSPRPFGPFVPIDVVEHGANLNRLFGSANLPTDLSVFSQAKPPEEFPFDFFLQFQFKSKDAADSAFADFSESMQKFEFQGKNYFRSEEMKNMVGNRVDEKTFEIGTDKYILQKSRRLFTPGLEKAWSRAPKNALRIVADLNSRPAFFEQLQTMITDQSEPNMKRTIETVFEMLGKVKDIAIGIDLDSENLVTATALGKSEEEVTELKGLLGGFLALGKMGVPAMIGELRKDGKEELADMFAIMNEKTGFEQDGVLLSFKIPSPEGLDKLLAESMPEPYKPPKLATKYARRPKEFVDYSADDSLAEKLKSEIQLKAFPDSFRARAKNARTNITIDPLDVPGLEFHEIQFEAKSVTSKEGEDLLGKVEESEQSRYDSIVRFPDFGDHIGSSTLRIPIKDGVQKEQLDKAKVEFTVSSPKQILVFELDNENKTQTRDGVTVTLQQIKESTVDVRWEGAEKFEMVAYDDTGKQLMHSYSSSSAKRTSSGFHGQPTKIKVAAFVGKLESKFEVEFDLNSGKALELPKEPSADVRERVRHASQEFHANISADELKALKVQWVPAEEKFDSNRLRIEFPRAKIHVKDQWEHYFFGKDANLTSYSNKLGAWERDGNMDMHLHRQDPDKSDEVCAAFGKIKLIVSENVELLRFKKVADGEAIERTTKTGETYKLTIDRNQAVFDAQPTNNIIERAALNKDGKYLVRSDRGNQLICWGQIDEVILEVRSGTTNHFMDYELVIADHDKEKYKTFKQQLEKLRELSTMLRTTYNKTSYNSARYKSTLAGMHYVYGGREGKDGKPMELVSKEIAHSDPKGVKQFGYKLTPYMGYHFTFAKGKSNKDRPNEEALDPKAEETLYKWEGGEFKDRQLKRLYIVGIPVDPKDPVLFTEYGQVYYGTTEDGKLEYIPDYSERDNFSPAKFIEEPSE